jgi:hypothetical protein
MTASIRVTIDKVDQREPLAEWKPRLADVGRRRHLSFTMDFDTRAQLLEEPGDGWEEAPRRLHVENRENLLKELAHEFGKRDLDAKIQNFKDVGSKPFSLVAYHNMFFEQVRRAFVMGNYYPALVAACALGERILNHLILDLRGFYSATPEYSRVAKKQSFDNWHVPINALEAWSVLRPNAATAFRALCDLRNRSIHFNIQTYSTVRDDALKAIGHLRTAIAEQFGSWGQQPWFIKGTRGHLFIARSWEADPFISTYFLPQCPLVGPHFAISFEGGLRFHDHNDYGDGDWSDEEFAAAYESGTPDQLATPRRD